MISITELMVMVNPVGKSFSVKVSFYDIFLIANCYLDIFSRILASPPLGSSVSVPSEDEPSPLLMIVIVYVFVVLFSAVTVTFLIGPHRQIHGS